MWVFNCYVEQGVDLIDAAVNRCPPKVRAKFFERLNAFRDQPQHLWNGKRSKQLKGYDGIIEIRFFVQNVQYRPLGYFGPQRGEFTLLYWATEQGGEFVPKDAPAFASERRGVVNSNSGAIHVCDF